MTYREWILWITNLKWSVKWFVIFILIRPIVDNFYYLKDISPLISPNYIVGILTPLLAIYGIFTLKMPNYSRMDTYMRFFTIICSMGSIVLLISDSFSMNSIEHTIKVTFPCYVYFFLRRMILSKEDLYGLLQAFVYSSVIVAISLGYEILFQPIKIQISRGLERYQGFYSDVLNYALHMCGTLVIVCFAYLTKDSNKSKSAKIIPLIITIIFTAMVLFNIHHTASYAVVLTVFLLFMLFNFKKNAITGIIFVAIFIGIGYIIGPETVNEKVLPLIETDIEVYEGEQSNEKLLHGRVGRWTRFLDYFFEKNMVVQLLGLPFTFENPYMYIGKGVHNDFVRMLLGVGFIGITMYLIILGNLFVRLIKYKSNVQFLGLGFLSSLILYSVSTTPLLYPTLMNIILPVICVLALPKEVMENN